MRLTRKDERTGDHQWHKAAAEFLSGSRRILDAWIPVGSLYDFQHENLSRSVTYFPIVGMVVGLAGGIVLTAGHLFLPALIAVLSCMAATVAA